MRGWRRQLGKRGRTRIIGTIFGYYSVHVQRVEDYCGVFMSDSTPHPEGEQGIQWDRYLEVICESFSGGVDFWIEAAVYFHNTLHILRAVRVTDTAYLRRTG